jgi:hypothetical protein
MTKQVKVWNKTKDQIEYDWKNNISMSGSDCNEFRRLCRGYY